MSLGSAVGMFSWSLRMITGSRISESVCRQELFGVVGL